MAFQDLTSKATSNSGAPDSSISEPTSLFLLPTRLKRTTTRRPRTSPIWDHTPFDNRNDIILNRDNRVIWRCKYCPQEYIKRGGTGIIFQHLASAHSIDIKTNQDTQKGLIQDNIATAFARVAQSGEHKRCRLDSTIPIQNLDPNVLERLYVQWLSRCGIPFAEVERIEFRS